MTILQRVADPLPALGRGHAAVGERQFDVLVDREIADQIEGLEDESDLPVPDPGPLRRGQTFHRMPRQGVGPGARRIEEPEDREQGRLPAARRPGDGDVLALVDGEVDVGERVGLQLVGVEDLLDAIEPDEGV